MTTLKSKLLAASAAAIALVGASGSAFAGVRCTGLTRLFTEQAAGGLGGNEFCDSCPGLHLSEVRIRDGWYIDNIQAVFDDGEDEAHGGNGGIGRKFLEYDSVNVVVVVTADGDKVFVGIQGKRDYYADGTGKEEIKEFQFNAPTGFEIVGFCGRAGWVYRRNRRCASQNPLRTRQHSGGLMQHCRANVLLQAGLLGNVRAILLAGEERFFEANPLAAQKTPQRVAGHGDAARAQFGKKAHARSDQAFRQGGREESSARLPGVRPLAAHCPRCRAARREGAETRLA